MNTQRSQHIGIESKYGLVTATFSVVVEKFKRFMHTNMRSLTERIFDIKKKYYFKNFILLQYLY